MGKQERVQNQHDRLPFYIDHLMPPFSYQPHSSLTRILFGVIVGLVLVAIISGVYIAFIW